MSTYDDTDSDEHPMMRRLIGVGLFLLAQGIAVIVIGFLALLVSFVPSWSATPEPAALLQPGEASSGMPLVQVFRNPTQSWVEATYLYPLATNAAVDALKIVAGNRVIVGATSRSGQPSFTAMMPMRAVRLPRGR